MAEVSNFDVLKRMSERSMDIRLAPLSNIIQMKKVKAGTQVTIGCPGDVITGLTFNQFVGGLLLADQEQFDRTKAEMEAEAAVNQ